jgi:leucyl aminopeptidase
MTDPMSASLHPADIDAIEALEGRVVIFADEEGKLDRLGKRVNRLCKGGVNKLLESKAFEKAKDGDVLSLSFPVGMAAEAISVAKLAKSSDETKAQRCGAKVGALDNSKGVSVLAGNRKSVVAFCFGLRMRVYNFDARKSEKSENKNNTLKVFVNAPDDHKGAFSEMDAMLSGIFFTRDLTNEPANILTTTEFANRLEEMKSIGLEVEVYEEDRLEKMNMHSFLAVGYGSETPTKMVVMRWNGGGDEAPFALVGKGVVFDTGGISIKPAGGMEDMTMDMGGAGVVSGVMRALALRKAKANVVGVVGLVENMPDGRAQRPGDVVTSMKGDTIEVINTDAEGRLVLADVMWFCQEEFKPVGMIDLATLTGAMVVALGHENAGAFSNDDALVGQFLAAAADVDEGAWRMPLGDAYADLLKSKIADVKNVGGRWAGSITAAEFLKRFVKPQTPWIHLDIAGVASRASASPYAPAGASGWGVRALDRLIRDNYESRD